MSSEKSKNGTGSAIENDLTRFVLERQLATSEEIQRCRELAEKDGHKSLAQVLLAEEVITRGQMERVKRLIQEARAQQIPGYRLVSKLGSGAMATVYKAVQVSLDRVVAVKILPKRLSENPEYVAMFYKEGRAAAKLNHPNIVQAIDVGEAGGYHYFVMEFVEGHTLFDELDGGKVFPEAEALQIIIQIAKALQHAHELGLIHRDVKPKNIMMTKDGTAKLADMGLAREVSDMEAAQAEAGRAFGTPFYISPEQIRGEVNVDFRTDIYSLAATLYHCITGRVPFDAPTPVGVMHKHLKEPLIPPDHINTALSVGISEVVEVMMAKDRSRRYASTSDLLLDLQAIASGGAPLQARKQIDVQVLSGLGEGDQSEGDATGASSRGGNWTFYLILLGAALALSVIVNVVLLLTRS